MTAFRASRIAIMWEMGWAGVRLEAKFYRAANEVFLDDLLQFF